MREQFSRAVILLSLQGKRNVLLFMRFSQILRQLKSASISRSDIEKFLRRHPWSDPKSHALIENLQGKKTKFGKLFFCRKRGKTLAEKSIDLPQIQERLTLFFESWEEKCFANCGFAAKRFRDNVTLIDVLEYERSVPRY